MIWTRALLATLVPLSLLSVACGDEVGTCDDPNLGHDTVEYNGVQFGGQAIINAACAGCHGSGLKGASRKGAPAGLDFDLYPIAEEQADGEGKNQSGDSIVMLKPSQVAGLRERQRRVFEERNLIWQQVTDELMPPSGIGKPYRTLAGLFDSSEETPCVQGKAYLGIMEKRSQDVLRNWLACGAPIVESQGAMVNKNLAAGAAGYQFPMCGGEPPPVGGEPSGPVTLATLQAEVFKDKCTGCHSKAVGIPPLLDSVENSYASLVEGDRKCLDKPMVDVTGKDAANSFLYDLVSKEDPGCGKPKMPVGMPGLSASQLKLVSDWIAGGALKE